MVTLFYHLAAPAVGKHELGWPIMKLSFDEHNIITSPLTHDELMKILSYTENGTEDIISTRSKVFQKLNIDVDDLTIKELIQLISEYPNLLRRPIIMDNKRMQIGFNEDEIRAFLPRDYRKQELRQATIRAEIEGNND